MISAIVLAAGLGTRMGECKALLRMGDQPLLRYIIDRVKTSRVGEVVVVLGHEAASIRSSVSLEDVKVVVNQRYAEGMSTSIQAGLDALDGRAEAALVALADQPFVRSETINRLLDAYDARKSVIVLPIFGGFRGNPVLVARRLFPELMQIAGDVGCRATFDDHSNEIQRVPVDDPGVLVDIDTPQDYEKAVRLYANTQDTSRRGSLPSHQHLASESSLAAVAGRSWTSEQLLARAYELTSKGEPYALATVVRAEPPTSAKPGAKALVSPDGKLLGWIGGVCSQATVVEHALAALSDGRPRLLSISSTTRDGKPRDGVTMVPMECYSGGTMDIYIEPYLPQPRLLVVGHEPVGAALARLAKAMNIAVDIVDPLATMADVPDADRIFTDLASPEIVVTPETFVVVASHGRLDEEGLKRFVNTDAPYLALVASRKRAGVILEQLRSRGVSADRLTKIKAPAGLDIGAVTPDEVALSIIAEIVSIRRRTSNHFSAERQVEPRTPRQVVASSPPVKATEGLDPVCGMVVDPTHVVASMEYGGRVYLFCSEGCAGKFRRTPTAYIKS